MIVRTSRHGFRRVLLPVLWLIVPLCLPANGYVGAAHPLQHAAALSLQTPVVAPATGTASPTVAADAEAQALLRRTVIPGCTVGNELSPDCAEPLSVAILDYLYRHPNTTHHEALYERLLDLMGLASGVTEVLIGCCRTISYTRSRQTTGVSRLALSPNDNHAGS